ncbi:MAG TPA: 5-formyltetrahydrofolate cyclo-ligase [Nocardioidaceae bacterium]|nr:5-formyltetrahydrofolate cyclo-ligase [Nocardioidaceae bacterium]
MARDKATARAQLLATRRAVSPIVRARAGQRITQHLLTAPEMADAKVVAGYVGRGTEPPTLPLLTEMRHRGVRVVLPVLLADNDLDWAEFTDESELVSAGRGLLEPAGPRLGVAAPGSFDAMLVPGVAVGRDGLRLGRGGGSYDRVLARIAPAENAGRPSPWICVVLFDHEILDGVPADAHDRSVAAAATPSGITRFR